MALLALSHESTLERKLGQTFFLRFFHTTQSRGKPLVAKGKRRQFFAIHFSSIGTVLVFRPTYSIQQQYDFLIQHIYIYKHTQNNLEVAQNRSHIVAELETRRINSVSTPTQYHNRPSSERLREKRT